MPPGRQSPESPAGWSWDEPRAPGMLRPPEAALPPPPPPPPTRAKAAPPPPPPRTKAARGSLTRLKMPGDVRETPRSCVRRAWASDTLLPHLVRGEG